MLPFVTAGYVLQATTWSRGWQLTGAFWEHWIVKPVSLAIVAFPITLAIVWMGRRFVAGASTPRGRAVRAALSALPLGALYLAGLSVLN